MRYLVFMFFFFFKQKTAYEMRISDWSSDVCSSDLDGQLPGQCIAFHHRPSPIVVSHACRHRHQNLTGRRHATGKTAAARTALSTSPSTKGTAPRDRKSVV